MNGNKGLSSLQGWIIAVLLALILVAQLFSIVDTYQRDKLERERAATYEQRVEAAQQVLDRQREVISDLIFDYESVAYDNPNVDRIAEQQLLAAEYQLSALQAIAVQNSQIIELLAAIP
jgi:hypothetical protein